MSTTAGAVSKLSAAETTISVSSAVATGGATPYAYQWYRSTTSGFTPGTGSIVSGATSLLLNDSGLSPATQYYYKMTSIDSGSVGASSAQLAAATVAASQNQNQFAQSSILGMLDMKFNFDTISAQIDASEAGILLSGQAVKIVDSADGIPKVIAVAADTDQVFGYINFDVKSANYTAGDRCEISQAGNVMYLQATGAIARGLQVCPDTTTVGGVQASTGSSAKRIVGWALDKAAAGGVLIRVHLTTPSFKLDS